MKKWVHRLVAILMAAGLVLPAWIAYGQEDGCGGAPAPRLVVGNSGRVTFTDGRPLNVRDQAGLNGAQLAQLPEGAPFIVLDGPICADGMYWWQVQAGEVTGWVAEGADGAYFIEPVRSPGAAIYADWNWMRINGNMQFPDPMMIVLPLVYRGDLPALPVDLSTVKFIEDAGLNEAQRALLSQNGFVIIPGGFEQFHEAYREEPNWLTIPDNFDINVDPDQQDIGHAFFVTSDAMLHLLHYIFDNILSDLERDVFVGYMADAVLMPSLLAAHDQAEQAAGTPLEGPARTAELYLAVALELFKPHALPAVVSPEVAEQARAIAALALAGSGQEPLPFLDNYLEDFSQYRPRGHYEGDPVLENYFRGMMWLGRITFRAKSDQETLIALLLLRALSSAPGALDGWTQVHDTLTFLIGPTDDLGPHNYAPLAEAIFGPGLPLDQLADPGLVTQFMAEVQQLPGPRVNGLILSNPDAEAMEEDARGFRFMGQRFTFDAYVMQQLMFPYVGTREQPRILPLGLDVASALGSETAYTLAQEAGATDFANYDAQMEKLRGELGVLTDDQWLENVYGGWLWTLKPLFDRDPAAYPPMMNTEAWKRKDVQTGLASWTELKHDTALYVKQPGGAGGGGPPLTSFGYVEPNPLVFARIAVVAGMTFQGLEERGFTHPKGTPLVGYDPRAPGYLKPYRQDWGAITSSTGQMRGLALQAALCAEIARKELAGEPLTGDDFWFIYYFGSYLQMVLYDLDQSEDGPDPVALVTDVANNPDAGVVLQEGVGSVDYIYVIVPNPRGGYQLVRGGVFSYYEFANDINRRMTDSEWRALVAGGDLPPRPAWVSAFYSE